MVVAFLPCVSKLWIKNQDAQFEQPGLDLNRPQERKKL